MKSYTLRPDTFTLNFNLLFQMEAINIMKQRLMVNSRRRHLRLWNELICGPSREGTRKAKAHYRALTVPHYFEIWCLFVEKRDDGSNMRAWVGRERFDQVHNIRSVVEHRNKNTLTSHFQHWRVHAHCQIEVTRRYVAKVCLLNISVYIQSMFSVKVSLN